MQGGYLTGRRAGPVLMVALVLAVALMVGFRSWGGVAAAGLRGVAAACGSGPDLRALEQAALEVYREQTGDTGPVRVQVRDFGCHLQADVYKDGRLVESYIYRYGQWQEID
ncbi:MAG: hypothetical protein AB1503_03780 [Bacillota bacterium]